MPYPVAAVRGKIPPGGFLLPYTFNPASLADGALPWPWMGATFAISSHVVVNTPTLGAELLTDPGLEANYTAGKCDTLTENGGGFATKAQSADVHGGTKAQEFTPAAFNDRLNYPIFAGIAGAWYLYSIWAKRTAGTSTETRARLYQANALPINASAMPLTSATYAKKQASIVSTDTGNIFTYPVCQVGTGMNTVIVDDGSLKRLTRADISALLPAVSRLATVKAQPTACVDQTVSAVIAWASSADPTTYLFATWRWRDSENFINVGLFKCVAGVYSQLIAENTLTEIADAWVEIRPVNDTTVALYYNNTQVGTNQTVTDVPGNRPGLLITGGNTVKGFFVG